MNVGGTAKLVGLGLGTLAATAGISGYAMYRDQQAGDDPDREVREIAPREYRFAEIANPREGGSQVARTGDTITTSIVATALLPAIGLAIAGVAGTTGGNPSRAWMTAVGGGAAAGLLGGLIGGTTTYNRKFPQWEKVPDYRPSTLEFIRDELMANDTDGDGQLRRHGAPGDASLEALPASGYEKGWYKPERRSNTTLATEALDINRNGFVTPEEIDARLAAADRNNDGELSKREAKNFAKDNWLSIGKQQKPPRD